MLSILLHVNILDIRAVMISREKSFNSARRDFSAPWCEPPVFTHAALKKYQQYKNNDSQYSHSFVKAKKKERRRKIKRSLYNYILLRYNDLQFSRVAHFALPITIVACHSS